MGLLSWNPKTLLAKAIADALATYFDVNPESIESNLLKDAKIVLNATNFHPRTDIVQKHGPRTCIVHTTGSVAKVVFSWKWSLSKTTQNKKENDQQQQQEHQWIQDARGVIHKAINTEEENERTQSLTL